MVLLMVKVVVLTMVEGEYGDGDNVSGGGSGGVVLVVVVVAVMTVESQRWWQWR